MKHLGVILAATVLGAAAVATAITSAYIANVLSYAVVLAIFAVAVGLTFGQLGYVSFGHAAFLGVGAYTTGLLVTLTGLNYWLSVPLAIAPGLLLGALVGLASARLGGAYFAIATLTLAEMFRLVAINWVDVTRGPMGLMVMVPPVHWATAAGWTASQFYLFTLFVVLGVIVALLARLRQGPLERAWTFIREAPALAESVGIPTTRCRVINIALSGGIASLAGGLLIPKVLVLSPDLFGVHHSGAGLLAVILGGKATLIGPVVGGLIFGMVPEVLRFIDEYRLALFAMLLLIFVRVLPEGIASLLPKRGRGFRQGLPTAISGTAVRTPNVVPPLGRAGGLTQRDGHALEAEGISKRFLGLVAVDGVSVRVKRDELLGIIGPNGAGKTTFLSMLSGFLSATSGEVRLNGECINRIPPHRLAGLGLVRTFQQTAHCASLSAYDNVLAASHLRHAELPWAGVARTQSYLSRERDRQAHALACLQAVGLEDRVDAIAGTLPYGEQKLLGVAIALAADPSVLLLDEPAAGPNHTESKRLARVLQRLKASGCTICVVDHNLPLMMSICDRIVVLQNGRKIAEDTPKAVAKHPGVIRAYLGNATEEAVA